MSVEWLYCWLADADSAQQISWKEEAEAAEEVGFKVHSFDYEALLEGCVEDAVADLPFGNGATLVYRGWIMPVEHYEQLEDALHQRGYYLHSSVHQYRNVLWLPEYFQRIEGMSPPAVWTAGPDIDEAWELSRQWRGQPTIVKDYVKSAKEHWDQACFVPADCDRKTFGEVLRQLREVRLSEFVEGYVVRPLVELNPMGALWTGMPIYEEYRLVYWNNELLLAGQYFEGKGELDVENAHSTAFEQFNKIAQTIDSPFFTMDVARLKEGGWTIIELNPGGVAGLPGSSEPMDFYASLAEAEGKVLPEHLN